ncbi:methyltransferase domain-containing protein [Phycisphaeraceae bacterium D3-23]
MSEQRPSDLVAKDSQPPARERWYWRLRKWMTPGLRNAQYAYFAALDQTLQPGDRWLDIGCGRRIAPAWLRHGGRIEQELIGRADEVIGIDPDAQALADNALLITKRLGTAEHTDEPDASFDLITANMVVEHLNQPEAALHEAARLLRLGGRLLFHTPNRAYPLTTIASAVPQTLRNRLTAWLEKRDACDIYPTRYRMNRVATIERLAAAAGLEVESVSLTADSPETIGLGPLVAGELALIALTQTRLLRRMRSNLIITLRKPAEAEIGLGALQMGSAAGETAVPQTCDTSLGEAA